MPKPRILVIDDDAGIRESLKMTLEYDGYDVAGAATGQEGLALVEREAPDLVLLDVKMPGMDGLDVLTRLHSMLPALPVVMISGARHRQRGASKRPGRARSTSSRSRSKAPSACASPSRTRSNAARLRDENRSLKQAVEVRHQMIGESAGAVAGDGGRSAAPRRPTRPC